MKIKMHIFYYPNSFIATVRFICSDIAKSICSNSLKTTGWITTVFFCALAADNQNHNYRFGATCQLSEQNHVVPHKIEAILTLKNKMSVKPEEPSGRA